MKTILTLLLLASLSGISQITINTSSSAEPVKVGNVKSGTALVAELTYTVSDQDTIYTLRFQDVLTYQTIRSIQFNGSNNTANQLYNILHSFFLPENVKNQKYKQDFKLGDYQFMCNSIRVMGVTSVEITADKEGFFRLTEKQLNKLFGKH